jgi:hypothetical protein
MKMKAKYSLSLLVASAALLALSVPVHASTMDNRIESSAKKSYVFKTHLKGDDINIKSKDGPVALNETVSEESHNQENHEGMKAKQQHKENRERAKAKQQHLQQLKENRERMKAEQQHKENHERMKTEQQHKENHEGEGK